MPNISTNTHTSTGTPAPTPTRPSTPTPAAAARTAAPAIINTAATDAVIPSRALNIWANGILLGTWSRTVRGDHVFRYDDAWCHSPAARHLSLSLPLTPANDAHTGKRVLSFFDNLLPDSPHIRQRIQARFATDSTRAMDLLAAIGRDCAGALQFLPLGDTPSGTMSINGEPLTTQGVAAEIATALGGTDAGFSGDADSFRISIAGAQEKTALLWHNKRWHRPLGATPTTHILKLPLGVVGNMRADMSASVENEWLCLQIFAAFGLPVPPCSIAVFGQHKALVVQRFDRALQPDGWIARLPQEDFCQALGISGDRKYESDGGPGMRTILQTLDRGSRPQSDKALFLKACVLFWMLAATDGHGKNFSIFHERGGTYRLTPFYDILSAWPIVGKGANQIHIKKLKLAMALRSKSPHWHYADIHAYHWEGVGQRHGLPDTRAMLNGLVDATPSALDAVAGKLPKNFPPALADAIFGGVRRSADNLADSLVNGRGQS